MATEQDRLRAVVEAGIALASELSLDVLLQRVAETARTLTGARYAALGVLDGGRVALERFVHTGIADEQRALIGELPRGRGILGALIQDAKPLRLHAIADDPRSVGFPEHHPPMQTFLGVPVTIRGVAYGNLYLTEKEGGLDFTDEDEDVALLLAAQAGTAIENARLYESATGWARQLESLNEIIAAMASEVELPRLLSLVAARLRELVDARLVTIALPVDENDLRIEAADGEGAAVLLGARLGRDSSKHARVLERGHSERVDSFLDDPEVNQGLTRQAGVRSGLYVPLTHGGRRIGVMAAHDKATADGRFTDADVRLSEIFAARAAVAVDLSRRVAQDALERAIAAQETERRRLALELHDETGQELTSILLGLRAVEDAPTPEDRAAALAEVRALAVQTLQNVRRLAVELRPKALDDFGLVPALERLAESFGERTGMHVDVHASLLEGRLPEAVETTLYRVVQEALTNVVKHAQAENVSIILSRKGKAATAVVEDDGRGFDPAGPNGGIGLTGMRERLALIGGRLEVESGPGGTTIVAEAPLT
jgi:signal transduction histidine kinase